MCGIVGAFAFADTPSEELVLPIQRLTDRMIRRGPDDHGLWTDGRRCAFGFRRLAILDLDATGHQPMVCAQGTHVLVFNGEIYNFPELRQRLAERGLHPRSSGDAEVLLLALREWGPDLLADLNGMFAFALYDLREQRLLLARDHAGIKPLHLAETRHGIVFASQYDQLLAHPWCRDARVLPASLGLYLRFGFVPAPYGLHATTRQLEAGQWLTADARGTVKRGTFFDLPRRARPTLRGDSAVEAFDEVFGRAVKRHLLSDVPVGVLLSGGIDSPLVAAEAARQHGGSLQAFTIEVEDPSLDEGADARRYASEIGLEQISERATEATVLALLDDVVAASTEPTADYSMFPTLMVSRLARRHVKVVLSGDGGDELYWGYPSRFGSAIEQAPYFGRSLPRRAAAVVARRAFGHGHATRDVLRYPSVGRYYQKKHTLMAESDLEGVFPSLPRLPSDFVAFECRDTDVDAVAEWTRWNEFRIHLARVLAKVDRASMYNSLEVRVPLLDREVIDVAWRTDWRTCLDLRARVGKRVLRSALRRRVTFQTSGKRGFEVPMDAWLRGPLRPLLRELVLDRKELLGLPVDRGALATLEAQLRAGDRTKAGGLWLLLSLALWERAHQRSASA